MIKVMPHHACRTVPPKHPDWLCHIGYTTTVDDGDYNDCDGIGGLCSEFSDRAAGAGTSLILPSSDP